MKTGALNHAQATTSDCSESSQNSRGKVKRFNFMDARNESNLQKTNRHREEHANF